MSNFGVGLNKFKEVDCEDANWVELSCGSVQGQVVVLVIFKHWILCQVLSKVVTYCLCFGCVLKQLVHVDTETTCSTTFPGTLNIVTN
jgi:hypothetical protein